MSTRGGAVHVATTRRRYKGRVYETHLLRRTYREDGKVKHETLGNLSHLPPPAVEAVRRTLKGETLFAFDERFECVKSRPHGHVAAVLGTLRKLELDKILAARRGRDRDLVVAMIAARIIEPRSKLATARAVAAATGHSSLGETLGVEDAGEDELYAALDWLLARQPRIEKQLAQRHLKEHTLVLYDVTSTYVEGRTCPLARHGHSRDKRSDRLQIVFGLLCSRDGCPVAVEVFAGNTADPATLAPQIRKLRERFGLTRIVVVGDRGMVTDARIREELRPIEGLSWISALRSPAIKSLVEQGTVERSLFDETDLAEVTSPDFPDERLIVCCNPLLADERARKREALLVSTERALLKIAKATQRERNPLRGRDKIGERVGKHCTRHKVRKHFEITITDDGITYARKQAAIEAEAALDGIYIIRTNVPKDELADEDVVRTYKSLATVERAFRSIKTVDLNVRPIFHRRADRVRAHIFLCMLAYYVEWHMRRALAPLLFDDHDRAAAAAARESVVQKAQRSPAAMQKIQSRRTADGLPVQSFRDLLAHLGTIVKNWMRPNDRSAESFAMLTQPDPLQTRALDLLGVALRL